MTDWKTGTAGIGGPKKVPYIRFGTGAKHFVILPGVSAEPLLASAAAVARQYEDFGTEYTVTLIDRTDPLREGVTVGDMADDAAAAMLCMGITQAYVFGASQGGMIAMLLAARYPHLVRALAIGSSAAYIPPESGGTMDGWASFAESGDTLGLTRAFCGRLYSPETVRALLPQADALAAGVSPAGCRRFLVQTKACIGFDVRDELKYVRCPALALVPEEDRVIPAGAQCETARLLRAETVVLPGAAHAAYDEIPDYPARLKRFFDRR